MDLGRLRPFSVSAFFPAFSPHLTRAQLGVLCLNSLLLAVVDNPSASAAVGCVPFSFHSAGIHRSSAPDGNSP
jgi:hypothetical protein